MAGRKIRRYFTQQDFLDGKCDRNGIALVGKGLHTKENVTYPTQPVEPELETATNEEAQAMVDSGEAQIPQEAKLTAKERAKLKAEEAKTSEQEPTLEVPEGS